MEDTIAAVSAARAAGCTLECEIDAFCAARWHCTVQAARNRRPPVHAQLWRVGPDSVVLSVESDLMHVVPWSKIVVVAECSPCMDNDWAAECVQAAKSCVLTLEPSMLFELVTFSETVESHGEVTIAEETIHATADSVAHAMDTHRENSTGDPACLAEAMRAAGDVAVGERTLVLVMAYDARHDEPVDMPEATNDTHVHTACMTMGDRCPRVRHACRNLRHARMPSSVVGYFTDMFTEEMTQVARYVRIEVESTSRSKPIITNCTYPTVSRSVLSAGCVANGAVRTLFTHQRAGAEAYLQRHIDAARNHGVVWLEDRMFYKCTTVAEVHPMVDTGGIDDTVYVSRRPLYIGAPKFFALRMRDSLFDTVRVTLEGHDGGVRGDLSVVMRGDRAAMNNEVGEVARRERWASTVRYLHRALPKLNFAQMEALAHAAPTDEEAYLLRDIHRAVQEEQPGAAEVAMQCLWMVSQTD